MVLEILGIPCGWGDSEDVAAAVIESKSHDEYNPEVTGIPVLESNYDSTHPHSLYAALERRDWDQANHLLEPADGDVQQQQQPSAAPSSEGGGDEENKAEEEEDGDGQQQQQQQTQQQATATNMAKHEVLARTWIVRRDEGGAVKWRLLSLHAAVMFDAPLDLLDKLLSIHPAGAKLKDDEGNLPLHLGYSEGRSVEKVDLLRQAYPEGEAIQNKRGRMPGENFGASAAVRKVKDDVGKQLAELEETRQGQIAEKDEEIAALKEKHETELTALKGDTHTELDALNEQLEKTEEEHQAALKKMTDEKDGEIEKLMLDLAHQKGDLERLKQENEQLKRGNQELKEKGQQVKQLKEKVQQVEQRTPAPTSAASQTGLRQPQPAKKVTKSKSPFWKKGGKASSKTAPSKAGVPVIPTKTQVVKTKIAAE